MQNAFEPSEYVEAPEPPRSSGPVVIYQTKCKRYRIEECLEAHPQFDVIEEWELVDAAYTQPGAEASVKSLEMENPTSLYRIVDTEAAE